jgi:hypothetical protein
MYKQIAALIFILISAKAAAAPFGEEFLNVHMICVDESFNETWGTEQLFIKNIPKDEKIIFLFGYLFENGNYIPPGVKAISAEVIGGTLILNVSVEILNCAGSYTEERLTAQIIKTALDIPGINNITLLVSGENRPLTEGSFIFMENGYAELGI